LEGGAEDVETIYFGGWDNDNAVWSVFGDS
jgi:hypothetical protein